MSGHRALVSGASKSLAASASESGGQRQAFVRSALGPSSLRWVRSYRRSVPPLVWTSWTSQVRCVASASVGVEHSSVNEKGTKMSTLTPEDKFGIKLYSKPGPRTIDQIYSLLLGLVVLVLGVIGFIQTGFTNFTEMTDHSILGLFQTNGFHDLVYIIFGLLWMLGAFALTPAGNQGMNIAVGGSLLLVAILGFLGYLSLLSIPAGINGDNLLHLAVALASVIVGGGLFSGKGR